jgi:hypothetical protein
MMSESGYLNMGRKIRFGISLATLLWMAGFGQATATTVVAYRTTQAIVLGADSKMSAMSGATKSVCKIGVSSDNIAWGSSGLGTSGEYNLYDIVNTAMAKEGDIIQRIAGVETALSAKLIDVLNRIRITKPYEFKERLEGRPAAESVFVGFQDGVAHLHVRQLIAQSDSLGRVSLRPTQIDCPDRCGSGEVAAAFGHITAAQRELSSVPNFGIS